MKKLFVLPILIVTIFYSCQIKDENAPTPEETFIKYYGDLASQEAKDIEPIYNADSSDVEGFVIFGTQSVEGNARDFFVGLTDPNGNLITSNVFGFEGQVDGGDFNADGVADTIVGDDVAGQIEVIPGGYVLVGTTTVDLGTENPLVSFGIVAFLDEELNLIGELMEIPGDRLNFLSLTLNDVIRLSDGTFVTVGTIQTPINNDFYYRRFTSDSVYWEVDDFGDFSGNDILVRVLETDEGNIAYFGSSQDPGFNGELGNNVTFFETGRDNPYSFEKANSNGIRDVDAGNIFSEELTDVIKKPGGYLAVGFSSINNRNYSFFMDIPRTNGVSTRKDTVNSVFGLIETETYAVTTTLNNDFVLAGKYVNFRAEDGDRREEAMFIRLSQIGTPVLGAENNFGTREGDDVTADIITLPDGKIVMLSTIDFGGNVRLISMIKLNDTGTLDEE